jgi:hypothetical protein
LKGTGTGLETPSKINLLKTSIPTVRSAIEIIADLIELIPPIKNYIYKEILNKGNSLRFMSSYVISTDPRTAVASARVMLLLLKDYKELSKTNFNNESIINKLNEDVVFLYEKSIQRILEFNKLITRPMVTSTSKKMTSSSSLKDITNVTTTKNNNNIKDTTTNNNDQFDYENNISTIIMLEPMVISLTEFSSICNDIIISFYDISKLLIVDHNDLSLIGRYIESIMFSLRFICDSFLLVNLNPIETVNSSVHSNENNDSFDINNYNYSFNQLCLSSLKILETVIKAKELIISKIKPTNSTDENQVFTTLNNELNSKFRDILSVSHNESNLIFAIKNYSNDGDNNVLLNFILEYKKESIIIKTPSLENLSISSCNFNF